MCGGEKHCTIAFRATLASTLQFLATRHLLMCNFYMGGGVRFPGEVGELATFSGFPPIEVGVLSPLWTGVIALQALVPPQKQKKNLLLLFKRFSSNRRRRWFHRQWGANGIIGVVVEGSFVLKI